MGGDPLFGYSNLGRLQKPDFSKKRRGGVFTTKESLDFLLVYSVNHWLSLWLVSYDSSPQGLGEITRTHAHSPRILRVFSAHSPRIFRTRALRGKYAENARRIRGEYAENARRIRVSATRTFRVFSAHSPRNFRALKNFKKDPFFYFSKFFKILKSKKKSKKLKILKIFEKNHNFKKFQFFLNFKI